MKVYIYAKSGHGYGLDRVKRCCAVYDILSQFDPIFCTPDFRAGTFAKDVFGVKKAVSVDLIENLPNIMERGDFLVFDSDEPSEFMKSHMKDFCAGIIEFGVDTPKIAANKKFNYNQSNNGKKLFFFGDDDYHEEFLDLLESVEKIDLDVLLGHYYFLGNEEKITSKFNSFYEDTDYVEAISGAEFLLTGSLQAAIESLACGNKPVFFIRNDKKEDGEIDFEMLNMLQIPVIDSASLQEIIEKFENIIKNYSNSSKIERINLDEFVSKIKTRQKLLGMI